MHCVAQPPGPFIPHEEFAMRRSQLARQLSPGSCAVLFSGTTTYPENICERQVGFQADPAFFYLTGCNQPDAVLVLFPDKREFKHKFTQSFFFYAPGSEFPSVQTGTLEAQAFVNQAAMSSDPVVVGTLDEWESFCRDTLAGATISRILMNKPTHDPDGEAWDAFLRHLEPHYLFGHQTAVLIQDVIRQDARIKPLKQQALSYLSYFPALAADPILTEVAQLPDSSALLRLRDRLEKIKIEVSGLNPLLAPMRQVKSGQEVAVQRQAALFAAEAMREAIKAVKPGLSFNSLASGMAFLASSERASAWPRVHSGQRNNDPGIPWPDKHFSRRETAVLDLVVQLHGYLARITRTIPADGIFTAEARQVMEPLTRAHASLIENCRAGAIPSQIGEKSLTALKAALKESVNYSASDKSAVVTMNVEPIGIEMPEVLVPGGLKVNMVLLVETAVHFLPEAKVSQELKGAAFELRDVVVVQAAGPESLTGNVPTSLAELERLVTMLSVLDALVK